MFYMLIELHEIIKDKIEMHFFKFWIPFAMFYKCSWCIYKKVYYCITLKRKLNVLKFSNLIYNEKLK